MMSICDSRAKTFIPAPGARHGPTPKGCTFALRPMYVVMRTFGTSYSTSDDRSPEA